MLQNLSDFTEKVPSTAFKPRSGKKKKIPGQAPESLLPVTGLFCQPNGFSSEQIILKEPPILSLFFLPVSHTFSASFRKSIHYFCKQDKRGDISKVCYQKLL